MQAWAIMVRCSRCDILLEGREQFLGHMIHGHDASFERADAVWKSMVTDTRKSAPAAYSAV